MIDRRDVRSVTEFQRKIKDYVGRLKKKTPLVLTVKGRAERGETVAAIRRGMEQFERGEGISLADAEKRLRKKHGFPR